MAAGDHRWGLPLTQDLKDNGYRTAAQLFSMVVVCCLLLVAISGIVMDRRKQERSGGIHHATLRPARRPTPWVTRSHNCYCSQLKDRARSAHSMHFNSDSMPEYERYLFPSRDGSPFPTTRSSRSSGRSSPRPARSSPDEAR